MEAYVSLESSAAGADGELRMRGLRDGFARHCPIPKDRTWVLDGADRVVTARTQIARLLATLEARRIVVVGINETPSLAP